MEHQEIAGYVVEGTLGEGGMGVVYRGRDTTLDRPVAIKVIQATKIGAQGRERFLREARACSKINHPNIITVYAAGEDEGRPYLAMELIEGQTLREIVDQGPFEWKRATRCMVDLLDALARLHDEGIVHRDLKPENIMITKDGVIKLMDFGLVHLQSSTTLTEEGTTLGTVPYMSPEQVLGNKADTRSDIFSLASVFHEMITGLHPFRGEHPMAVMYSIRNETPRALKLASQEMPAGMQATLDRAFAKEVDKRFQTAREFREELIALLPDESLSGSRITPAQMAPAGRRNATIIGVFVAAAVLLLGGWYFLGPVRTRARAESLYELGELELYKEPSNAREAREYLDKAQEYYWQAIAADESYARPWNSLALIAQADSQYALADSYFDASIERDPSFEEAMNNRGSLRWDMADLDSARYWYEEAIRVEPDFHAAYNNLGSLLRETGELDLAKETLLLGLQKRPKEPYRSSMMKHRGLVAYTQGQPDSALYYLRAVKDVFAKDPEVQGALSELSQ